MPFTYTLPFHFAVTDGYRAPNYCSYLLIISFNLRISFIWQIMRSFFSCYSGGGQSLGKCVNGSACKTRARGCRCRAGAVLVQQSCRAGLAPSTDRIVTLSPSYQFPAITDIILPSYPFLTALVSLIVSFDVFSYSLPSIPFSLPSLTSFFSYCLPSSGLLQAPRDHDW